MSADDARREARNEARRAARRKARIEEACRGLVHALRLLDDFCFVARYDGITPDDTNLSLSSFREAFIESAEMIRFADVDWAVEDQDLDRWRGGGSK